MRALTDQDYELLMLWVDGELAAEPARLAEAEALAASHPEARAFVDGWHVAKAALREAVLAPDADLSRVRGRVMAKLPVEPRTSVVEPQPSWWQRLGLGKVSLAVGVAAVAAVALLLVWRPALQPETPGGAMAERDIDCASAACPTVIIEDTEVDDGGMMVRHGEQPGEATIIWHGAAAAGPTGEG